MNPRMVLSPCRYIWQCSYEMTNVPQELAELYRYVRTGQTEGALTRRIEAAVEKGRKNEIWWSSYMKERIIIMDAIEEEHEGRLKAEERADKAEEWIREVEEEKGIAEARIAELEALLAAK